MNPEFEVEDAVSVPVLIPELKVEDNSLSPEFETEDNVPAILAIVRKRAAKLHESKLFFQEWRMKNRNK